MDIPLQICLARVLTWGFIQTVFEGEGEMELRFYPEGAVAVDILVTEFRHEEEGEMMEKLRELL